MRRLITFFTIIAFASSIYAQGIIEEGATEVILPATRYTQEQWTVPTYNLRLGDRVSWGVDWPVLGTPPADGSGREWFEPEYTLTNGEAEWIERTSPFSSNRWYNGMEATQWADGDEPADFYFRRTFTTKVSKKATIILACGYDDSPCEYYINGTLVYSSVYGWEENKYITLTNEQKQLIYNDGRINTIAVHIHNNYGGSYADVGLYAVPYDEGDADADVRSSLVANEVQVSNIDLFIDNSYNYGAWIELYNKSDKRVGLGGLYISDDPSNPQKFCMPNGIGVIEPKGYKTVWFDHNAADGVYGDKARLQVPFKLNRDGGNVYISDADGTFMTISYPEAISRCSWARKRIDADEWGYNGIPTPAASNSDNGYATTRLEAPVVNTDSRFITGSISVKATIPSGATLRYTTDGSTPTLENGEISTTGRFSIKETTVLRLRLFQDGMLPSPVVTRSYITRDNEYYLPVLLLTSDPDNFYDDMIGAYTEGTNGVDGRNHGKSNRNMDWERPVNVEYITPDGKMVINQEAEFQVSGGWSRHYLPSSFKLKAGKLYEGINSFDYQFFAHKPYNKYKCLQVRNGGNDNDAWYRGRVKDAIVQQTVLTSGLYIDCQDYQPVHVFINGEYLGMLNLREPNNKYYGTANYGYDDDNMDAFEYSNGYFQMAGDTEAYNEWAELSQQADDEYAYEMLRNRADMDEFCNYMATELYVGGSDWLWNNNNSKGFRSRDNGKFHMTMFDIEWGFQRNNGIQDAMWNSNQQLRIFQGTMKNPTFRRQFIDTYCILDGSVYTKERSQAVADSIANLTREALSWEYRTPDNSINELLPLMTSESGRTQRMQSLRSTLGLDEGMQVAFQANVPGASFRVNDAQVPNGRFDGTLFAPVIIEATAPAGYDFVGWLGKKALGEKVFDYGDNWLYWDGGSLDGENWSARSYKATTWNEGPTPIGYGKGDIASQTAQRLPTYYLRKVFKIEEKPAADDVYTVNWIGDDGFVAYVNGKEVYRYLMPEGQPTYNTWATTFAEGNPDRGSFTIPSSYLGNGTNVIAVELHNVENSSDIYWNAELTRQINYDNDYVSTDRQLVLDSNGDCALTAIFQPVADEYLIPAGATPVVINEVSAANTIYANDYFKRNDWIELYNTTAEPIDIAGMYLSDNPSNPHKYQITADIVDTEATIIPAHGHLIIWADKLDPLQQLHASFKLGNNDGETLLLTAADDSWTDKIEYMQHTGEETVGRYPDGGKRIYKMTHPTIKAPNQLTTYAEWLSGEDVNFDVDAYLATLAIDPAVIGTDTPALDGTEYYTIDGVRLDHPQRGLNIIRLPNGTVKKVLIK